MQLETENRTVEARRHNWITTILGTFLLYVLIYGSISMRMGLHWDEVLDFDGAAYDTYIAAGRWFMGYLRACAGSWEPVWVPGFAGGLLLCGLVCVQARMLGLRDTWKKWAFIILYLGSVQWAYVLHYSFLAEAIAIGMCCATAAAWLSYTKRGWGSGLGAALLLAVAAGAYQTLAMYFGVAWLLLRLLELRRHPEEYGIMPWVRMACISIAGIAVWFGIHKVTLCFLSQETLDYVLGYQDSMSQWPAFLGDMSMHDRLLCLAHYFKLTMEGALGTGKESYWLFATALLPLCGLVWQALRRFKGWKRLEQCLIAALVWWLPFCMSLLLLSGQGLHTCLSAPLAFAGLWMVWLTGARLQDRHRPLLWIAGIGIAASAAATVFLEAKKEAALHRNSISLIASMEKAGRACATDAGIPQAPIVVLANLQEKEAPFCGAYPMVAGSGCMNWYCRAYGMNGIRMGNGDDMQRHRACWEGMPSWPEKGCIKEDGGEIIIKIERKK